MKQHPSRLPCSLPSFAFFAILAVVGPAVMAAEQAGVSAAVRGEVQLTRLEEPVGRRISSGEPIYLTDRISAGPSSGMQILLLDETIFTIGPNSQLTIDEFVYDPDSGSGRVSATVVKGVFRFVTGKVAAKNPEDMQVRTPFGTIGIRGTIVAGEVSDVGAEVILLGPGSETNTAERVGRIVVSNNRGSVTVTRPGYGTSIGGDVAPMTPAQVPPERISALTTAIARPDTVNIPAQNGGQEPAGQAPPGQPPQQQQASDTQNGQTSGNPPPQGAQPMTAGAGFSGQNVASGQLGALNLQLVQNTANKPHAAGEQILQQIHVEDGISRLKDLNTIASGRFHFDQTSALNSGGTYRIVVEMDFGDRRVGGGTSRVQVNSLLGDIGNVVKSLGAQSFDNIPNGLAIFGANDNGDDVNCASGANQCTIKVQGTLNNSNGIVAAILDHKVEISDKIGPIQTDTGSGSANRVPGPSP